MNDLIPPDIPNATSVDYWPSVPSKGMCEITILPVFSATLYLLLLPLSHKSSRLCWGRPLTVSDAFGDDFFEILSVFWVEIHSSFFSCALPRMI